MGDFLLMIGAIITIFAFCFCTIILINIAMKFLADVLDD